MAGDLPSYQMLEPGSEVTGDTDHIEGLLVQQEIDPVTHVQVNLVQAKFCPTQDKKSTTSSAASISRVSSMLSQIKRAKLPRFNSPDHSKTRESHS